MSLLSIIARANNKDLSLLELRAILDAHDRWIKTEGREGQRADLRSADLRKTNLWRANLQNAELRWANLEGANLFCANLQGADLGEVKTGKETAFGEATNLKDAVLREADLEYADLRNVKGFSLKQLAGAKTSGLKLPESIGSLDKGLERAAEIIKSARHVFHILLLVCIYTVFVLIATKDLHLISPSAAITLPLLGTPLSLTVFYLVAPLILFGLNIYFNLYLQQLWEELSLQPAVFPDGKRLNERAYPWFLTCIAFTRFKHLRENPASLIRFQKPLAEFLAWGTAPLTMAMLWWRYMSGHDWALTSYHITVLAVILWTCKRFYDLALATFSGKKGDFFGLNGKEKTRCVLRNLRLFFSLALFFLFLSFISINFIINLKLPRAGLSIKPISWSTGANNQVIGINLEGRNLRNADLRESFLVRARLRFANLEKACLNLSNMQEADLQGANLKEISMQGADLHQANLTEANLTGANLEKANLSYAGLSKAEMNLAICYQADLRKAELRNAQMNNICLQEANLTSADLTLAKMMAGLFANAVLIKADLHEADASNADFREADLTFADLRESTLIGANFQKAKLVAADFQKANLSLADFQGADLRRAIFHGAKLEGVNFKGADLTGSAGLAKEHLISAQIDQMTKLPADLNYILAERKDKKILIGIRSKNRRKRYPSELLVSDQEDMDYAQTLDNINVIDKVDNKDVNF